MAEVEAEYAAHKLRQEAKDREFADLLRSIESPPEKAGLFFRAPFNSYIVKKSVHIHSRPVASMLHQTFNFNSLNISVSKYENIF